MSNLVFVSGDFCSGSTLVFTLFRKSGLYLSLYEPLHERLPEYLVLRPDPDTRDHHFFAEDKYGEVGGFDRIPELHDPRWGNSRLHLPPEAEADGLYRYVSYVIGTAFGRAPRVMFKENRLAFRLGWIRARFPHAKIVHIHRDPEGQWRSNVRRVQEYKQSDDVGQGSVDYNGFNVATFCEDLKAKYPELAAENFTTGYARFLKLWELSYAENRKYADVSIDYHSLTHDFRATWSRVWEAIGAPPCDLESLEPYVVAPERQAEVLKPASSFATRAKLFWDRWAMKYARSRLRLEKALRERRRSSAGPG
jgi:sulfotransferase family protein